MHWQTTRFNIDLTKPKIMGIVNVTPDSFSDGGQHASTRAALAHCEQLIKDGADILDIGGESSRPGALALPLADELARVLPVVIEAVKLGVAVSVDTYKSEVMQAALDAGADIINDIWAFRQPGAAQVIARYPQCGLVLMHMHGEPKTMQLQPMVEDAQDGSVVQKVKSELLYFCEQLTQEIHGFEPNLSGKSSPQSLKNRVVLDPGIGFGKTVQQNFALLAGQSQLQSLGFPLMAGWSRKSALGAVTGLAAADRLLPSVVAAILAVERGANIVRVHDVRETALALAVRNAMK